MKAEQPQGEQEPVAWIWAEWSSRKLTFDGPPAVPSVRDELTKPVWTPLYTHPQPKREPLTKGQIDRIVDDLDPLFLDTPTGFEEDFCRAIERAHGIGGEA